MAELNDMLNTPVELEVCGRKLKLRRLALEDVYADAEAAVVSDHLERVTALARGLDAADRPAFLAGQLGMVPSGQDLALLVQRRLDHPNATRRLLWLAARRDQPDIRESDLTVVGLPKDDLAKVEALVAWLAGFSGKAEAGPTPPAPAAGNQTAK